MTSLQPTPESSALKVSTELQYIDDAILLHNKVFNLTEPSHYNNKDEWIRRITHGGYFAVVLENDSIKGFTVCDLTGTGEFKIWLAGVDPVSRERGVWTIMYDHVVAFAKEKGYEHILLNTFPQKFPMMFSFLQKMNAELYKEEHVDGFKKVYAKIKI